MHSHIAQTNTEYIFSKDRQHFFVFVNMVDTGYRGTINGIRFDPIPSAAQVNKQTFFYLVENHSAVSAE
jgi:hypothetical protein